MASEWLGGAYEQLLSRYEQLLLQNSMLKQQLTVCAEEQQPDAVQQASNIYDSKVFESEVSSERNDSAVSLRE